MTSVPLYLCVEEILQFRPVADDGAFFNTETQRYTRITNRMLQDR